MNAPGQVQVAGQGLTVTGVGLTGHPNERNFTLLSQTNTVVVPKKRSDLKSGKSQGRGPRESSGVAQAAPRRIGFDGAGVVRERAGRRTRASASLGA